MQRKTYIVIAGFWPQPSVNIFKEVMIACTPYPSALIAAMRGAGHPVIELCAYQGSYSEHQFLISTFSECTDSDPLVLTSYTPELAQFILQKLDQGAYPNTDEIPNIRIF